MLPQIAAAVATLCTLGVTMAQEQVVLQPPNFEQAGIVRPAEKLPTLADLLTIETRASIFYSYAREVDIGVRLSETTAEGEGITVFVPTNKAVQALARKPNQLDAGILDNEYQSISKSNVRRWVGAHMIPSRQIDMTSSQRYGTLTSGVNVFFEPISANDRPRPAVHLPTADTDADHFASVKGQDKKHGAHVVDTDADHFPTVKGPRQVYCPAKGVRMGLAAAGRVDTDAAHFASVKGPAPPGHMCQVGPEVKGPLWERYLLNGDVRIIGERQASNGVMYLIDGTVPV